MTTLHPDSWDQYAAVAERRIAELTAENERLRRYLGRALDIAVGSGGDFRWDVADELRQMRSYQQQRSTRDE